MKRLEFVNIGSSNQIQSRSKSICCKTGNLPWIIYPDYLQEKMTEEEKEAIPTAFHCSLYDDLLISLEDVFSDTF